MTANPTARDAARKAVARAILKARFYDGDEALYESLDQFYAAVDRDHVSQANVEAAAAIAAFTRSTGEGWREVKRLEWTPGAVKGQFAHAPMGLYFYLYLDAEWHLERHEGVSTTHSVWPSEDDAKAFAQSKFAELVAECFPAAPHPPTQQESQE